jgi:hypothetical protein
MIALHSTDEVITDTRDVELRKLEDTICKLREELAFVYQELGRSIMRARKRGDEV